MKIFEIFIKACGIMLWKWIKLLHTSQMNLFLSLNKFHFNGFNMDHNMFINLLKNIYRRCGRFQDSWLRKHALILTRGRKQKKGWRGAFLEERWGKFAEEILQKRNGVEHGAVQAFRSKWAHHLWLPQLGSRKFQLLRACAAGNITQRKNIGCESSLRP